MAGQIGFLAVLVMLLLLVSPFPLLFAAVEPGTQGPASNQVLAAAAAVPATPYTATSGTITLTVNGATFAAKNLTADSNRNANFVFLKDAGAKVSISVTSDANPYKSAVTSSRLEIDQVTGSKSATGSSGQLTASGTFDDSLDYYGLGDITINVRFDCFVNCPSPNAFAQQILLDFVIAPSVTVQGNASSVSIPGSIELQGDVVPKQQYVNLYTIKDGALQKWQDYNYEPLQPDSSGHFDTTVSFTQQSQRGNYVFIVNATSDHPSLITMSSVTAKSSVAVSVGGATVSSTTEHRALPVIIIPGIGGSELQSSTSGGGCGLIGCHEVWPIPFSLGYHFSDLSLNSDGTQPSGMSVYATDILQSGSSQVNFYGPLVTSLVNHGYVLGKSLFVFPYDWRLDNSPHLGELDALVNQARTANDSQQVILIAHSMGGLIATAYVNSSPSRAARVQSIITMGSPFFGSPKVYYGLTEGYALDNGLANVKEFKLMMQNWPGVYELLPKVPFIQTGSGYLSLDTTFGIAYNSAYGYNTLTFNPDALAAAQTFNSMIGTPTSPVFPSSVKLYTIIGYESETLAGYSMRTPTQSELAANEYVTLNGAKTILTPIFGDGDGTVPLWGAENNDATAKYFISPSDGGGAASHGALPRNSLVQNIVLSIVSGSPDDPANYRYPYSTTTKTGEDSTDFTIHSNANLQIVDQNGNVLGWNGGNGTISEDIGGGTFIDQDGVQYAAIAGSPAQYEVRINGTGTGTFRLTINETSSGHTTNIAYPEIPTAIGTVSKLAFDPAQLTSTAGPSLSVMSDGSTTSTYSPTSVSQVVATNNGQSSSSWGAGLLLIAGLALVVILPAYFLRRGKRRKSLLTVQVPAAARASKVAPSVTRFCSRCGGPTMPGTAYCASCGSPLVRN